MFWTRTIVNFVILTSNIATISIFWNPIGAGAQDEIGDFDYENICSENDTLVENYDYFNITETTGEDGNRRLLIQQASSRVSRDPEDIKFYLYRDPRNPNTSQELILNNPSSVQNSRFDTNQKTVFVIHGYQNNGNSAMGYLLRKRFFDANLIYNVIIVDWGKLSTPQPGDPWHFTYPTIATRSVPIAATRVANFIQFLLNNRFTTLDRIHLIGHSLGAHVSGRAGGEVTSSNGDRKLSRISGLDPAGPSFGSNGQRRLSESDAEFVDVYHTNAGDLLGGHAGINVYNLGHANYLVNGGQTQPGCDFISNISRYIKDILITVVFPMPQQKFI